MTLAMVPSDGDEDASLQASAIVVGEHVDYMLSCIKEGRDLKSHYKPKEIELINACSSELDWLTMIIACSKLSDASLEMFEHKLNIIRCLVASDCDTLFDDQEVRILTLFVMVLSGLKKRSKMHLENFLSAVTDGVWMDALIVGKAGETEFRAKDKASDECRKEFGV